MENQVVSQLPAKTGWRAFQFANNTVRIFNCNAILFINRGTATVFINNVSRLEPVVAPAVVGESLSLSCDQNEIDDTPYQITFSAAGTRFLEVWVKENPGSSNIYDTYLPEGTIFGDRRLDAEMDDMEDRLDYLQGDITIF